MLEHVGAQALHLWLYGEAVAFLVVARHTYPADCSDIAGIGMGLELLRSVLVFAHVLTIPVRVQDAQVALQSPQKPL